MDRTEGDDPGWLTDEHIKKINGLARSPGIGGVYPAWLYINKTEKEPNYNPTRLAPTLTAEGVQQRVLENTGKKITKAQAQKKADRENSTNLMVDFWADSMGMAIPTNIAIAGLAKVGAKVLPKVLANPIVRKALSKAAEQGRTIPPKIQKAAQTAVYQTTGKLPKPKVGPSTPPQATPRVVEPVRAYKPFSEAMPKANEIPIPRTSGGRFAQGQPQTTGWAARPRADQVDFGALTPRPQSAARPSSSRPLAERQAAVRTSTAPIRSTLPGPRNLPPQATGGGRTPPRGVRRYSPERGPNIPRTALAAALGTALFDNLDSNQKAVLEEAKKIEAEQIRAYDSEEETNWWEGYTEPSDSTDSTDGQIAEPAFGRMLGLRRSAEEIERDVAITEALDAGNYDRVAELEKQYGSAPVEDSLTYRTKDYTPEEIDAALAQDSGSVLEDLQSLIGDIEHGTDSDSDLIAGANYNSGGTVAKKPRKKKKKANSGSSKSYTTQPRKPSRA